MLTDTHCHIHEDGYALDTGDVMQRAHHAGVKTLICVGTSEVTSKEAIIFASNHDNVFATIGVHPHDTKEGWSKLEGIAKNATKLVAVGEIGLDYFYTHSPREVQIEALQAQIQLAMKLKLPIVFHVREAFDDFWPIFDSFSGLKGVLHSFTDTVGNLEQGLKRGLFIGVNGISTFTKDEAQKAMYDIIPLDRMLLETDAPYLTPVPHRGKVNEPAFVRNVAEYHAARRGVELEHLARVTTANASTLFSF